MKHFYVVEGYGLSEYSDIHSTIVHESFEEAMEIFDGLYGDGGRHKLILRCDNLIFPSKKIKQIVCCPSCRGISEIIDYNLIKSLVCRICGGGSELIEI